MSAATRDEGAGGGDKPLARAAEIFLTVRELGLAARDEEIARQCAGNAELKDLVLMLLRGDNAPLPVESLADDIRAAQVASASAPLSPTIPAPSAAIPPESRIGNYKLLERLGEGGFGIVYMAEQERPVRRRVALKIIKLGMDTRQVVARFEAERQALAMMDHPGIARVFDAGATETGRPYFVMELVRGLPITEYCDQHKLPIRQRLELVAQVCEALQHAHQKGVIHRDIKPSNVLVSTIDDKPVPKIIDFGIAKATSSRLSEKTIFTEFRQMIGTPEYMSPEQAGESRDDVDTRTDVYSVGVLLYELLTGAPPFDSNRLRSAAYGEMQRIIREEDPPKPSTRLTHEPQSLDVIAGVRAIPPAKLSGVLRGELDWIVMKALEKDRTRRYDSAGSMSRDIQRHLNGEAVQAAPPSALYRARKFVRRNKGPVVAASLLALALVAGLIGTSLGFFNAARQRDEAQIQRDRATAEKQRADTKAEEALASEAQATRLAYAANLLSACDAMTIPDTARARSYLDDAPQRLRGWEWDVLHSRLDISTRILPAPAAITEPAGVNAWAMLHPDGRSFFTLHPTGSLAARQWDLVTGDLLAEFEHPPAEGSSFSRYSVFSLSSDGTRLCVASDSRQAEPAVVSIWDLPAKQRIMHRRLEPTDLAGFPLAISPDGSRLLLGRERDIRLQDTATGKLLASTRLSIDVVGAWHTPDGSRILVADGRGGVLLIDALTLDHAVALAGHRNAVANASFSRDGRWLATSSLDDTARLWDLHATPVASTATLEHPQALGRCSFSPDASLVATACGDGVIRVWDARSGEIRVQFTAENLLGGTLMFLPDNQTVAVRHADGSMRFWDVTAESTVNLDGHSGLVNAAHFAEKTGLIVSAGWDGWTGRPGCIRLSDSETGVEIASLGEPGQISLLLAVSPEGTRAAAEVHTVPAPNVPAGAALANGVKIIDLETGRMTFVEGRIESMSFDPSGESLALGNDDRVEIRSARDGSLIRTRESGFVGRTATRLAWSPDGRFVMCESRLADVSLPVDRWEMQHELLDARTLNMVHRFDSGPITFAPDGTSILVGSPSGVLRIVKIDTWEEVGSIDRYGLGRMSITFSPDGTRFAACNTRPEEIIVCNAGTFDRVARFNMGDGYVASASWSADGTRLIGACGGMVRVWDATPLHDRVQARQDRQAALEIVAPLVERLFTELGDATKVIASLDAHTALSELQRKVARQEVLRYGLAQQRPGVIERARKIDSQLHRLDAQALLTRCTTCTAVCKRGVPSSFVTM